MVATNDIQISVAVATYNRALIVRETIARILGQTHPPQEVVVIDDGSTDETQAVIENMDPRVRYRKIDNVGPGAALKLAIESCTHDWIAVCDDDDQWHPDHLARRVRLLAAFPEAEFTFSNFTAFGSHAVPNFDMFAEMPPGWWDAFAPPDAEGFQWLGRDLLPRFLEANPVFPTTACFSRALYQRCGGIDPQYSRLGCWDGHFIWRCVLHGAVACDRHQTVSIRRHGGNFSRLRARVCLQRVGMLQSAWEAGWIPAALRPDIERAIRDSRLEGAWSAWDHMDYPVLLEATRALAPEDIPRGLKRRALFARLPKPLRNLLRPEDKALAP